MKKLVFILFFIPSISFSQGIITKNLGDFQVLKTYRGLTVQLNKSDTPKIVIEGEKNKDVVVKNVNGVLKITMSVLETFSATQVKVFVFYTDEIDHINANEGSIISSNDTFKQEKLKLDAQEAGKINLTLDTKHLDIKVITGGVITVSGNTENQDVSTNTGGIYNGEDLNSNYANVTASSGSSATVKALKLVDANAKLGATINLKGEPEDIKKRESFGGYVRQ